jgi:hypothetical protein
MEKRTGIKKFKHFMNILMFKPIQELTTKDIALRYFYRILLTLSIAFFFIIILLISLL